MAFRMSRSIVHIGVGPPVSWVVLDVPHGLSESHMVQG